MYLLAVVGFEWGGGFSWLRTAFFVGVHAGCYMLLSDQLDRDSIDKVMHGYVLMDACVCRLRASRGCLPSYSFDLLVINTVVQLGTLLSKWFWVLYIAVRMGSAAAGMPVLIPVLSAHHRGRHLRLLHSSCTPWRLACCRSCAPPWLPRRRCVTPLPTLKLRGADGALSRQGEQTAEGPTARQERNMKNKERPRFKTVRR